MVWVLIRHIYVVQIGGEEQVIFDKSLGQEGHRTNGKTNLPYFNQMSYNSLTSGNRPTLLVKHGKQGAVFYELRSRDGKR